MLSAAPRSLDTDDGLVGERKGTGDRVRHQAVSVGMMLPIGFGIEPPDLLALCVDADRRGLHAVGCGELAGPEALSLMGAAAAATANIRLETGVVPISSRSPALLAMAACTLAALSADRFVLGIGAGSPIVSSYHADVFERPVDRVAEALATIKAALAGERLADRGGFKLRGIRGRPVRVFMAAMNERMLQLAACEADGVVIHFVGPEQMAELAPRLRQARAAAGNEAPFEIIALVHAAAGPDGDADRAYRREMAPYLAVPAYRGLAAALSSKDEVDAAAEAWQRGGREASADIFPPGIAAACLAVGREAIADRVASLGRAGCDGVRLVPLSTAGADAAPVHDLVDCLAAVIDDLSLQEVVS